MRVLKGHVAEVVEAVSSRDGKRLFTATREEVRVWEVATGEQLCRIPAGPGFGQMTLSGDEKWFVSEPDLTPKSAPHGRFILVTIPLWEVATGKEVRRFEIAQLMARLLVDNARYLLGGLPRSDEVLATALSYDGKWLVAGSRRGFVLRWDTATGKEAPPFGFSKDWTAVPLGFSKDGKWLATLALAAPPEIVRLWDVATGKQKHQIQGNAFFGRGLSDDGQWLLTGRDETTVRIGTSRRAERSVLLVDTRPLLTSVF